MDDLMKRLRDDAWLSRATNNETELFRAKLPDEAADAIEALQAQVARLTAERDAIAALTVERCAEVAKVGWVSADYDLVGIADADMAMKLCEHIAAAIRAMKGGGDD